MEFRCRDYCRDHSFFKWFENIVQNINKRCKNKKRLDEVFCKELI